jgi:hypothetical protein
VGFSAHVCCVGVIAHSINSVSMRLAFLMPSLPLQDMHGFTQRVRDCEARIGSVAELASCTRTDLGSMAEGVAAALHQLSEAVRSRQASHPFQAPGSLLSSLLAPLPGPSPILSGYGSGLAGGGGAGRMGLPGCGHQPMHQAQAEQDFVSSSWVASGLISHTLSSSTDATGNSNPGRLIAVYSCCCAGCEPHRVWPLPGSFQGPEPCCCSCRASLACGACCRDRASSTQSGQ